LKFFYILVLISFQLSAQSPRLLKKATKLIEKTYAVDDIQLKHKEFQTNSVVGDFYKIIDSNQLLGYAFIGTAPSKTDTFEYLVVFDSSLVIKKVNVLVYREDYGGEIGSNRWLRQFVGKARSTDLAVGKNIAAISGATISVYSMTNAVNQLLNEMNKFENI
jgi:Na+-translocating ferredoxin:NAD+ oxidoreductase RnfG subunit|tara:strand:- start:185 stop:670 length:486 start_codon:yes stop_codon:yes gene_type:complete